MPKASKPLKTKQDREAEKQRVKTLYYSGQTLSEAARAVGVTSEVARQWASRHGWTKEIQGVKQLVQSSSHPVTPDLNIAFDLAETNKKSRAALAQIANLSVTRKLKKLAETEDAPGIIIEDASDFAAITKATAQIAGDWEDQGQGNKLAIAINIGQMASDPKRIRPLLPQELQDLRDQGIEC